MDSLIYFLPLAGALAGWGLALAITRYLAGYFRKLELASEVDPLLNHHLDELVGSLKQQIPMAGMFLTESLTGKLKGQAKGEFYRMIPTLKERLIERCLTRNLTTIQWAGAAFGFVMGLLQLLIRCS